MNPQVNAAVLKLDCCKDPGQVSKSSLKQHFTKLQPRYNALFSIKVKKTIDMAKFSCK